MPMIALSLQIAATPVISRALASKLAGNGVSVFMYRRQCSAVLGEIFSLGSRNINANEALLLPRRIADELVLSCVSGLIAIGDISAPCSEGVFPTDASMCKGSFASKTIGLQLAEPIWLNGDKKGAYTLFDSPARQHFVEGLGH